jgi:hypothetical protein
MKQRCLGDVRSPSLGRSLNNHHHTHTHTLARALALTPSHTAPMISHPEASKPFGPGTQTWVQAFAWTHCGQQKVLVTLTSFTAIERRRSVCVYILPYIIHLLHHHHHQGRGLGGGEGGR